MNAKQYLRLIKAFFNSHNLINTTKSGNQFNFNCLSRVVYPIAHIEYLRQSTTPGDIAQSYLVTIADILDPNLEDSEEDIYSDTAEICQDALAYFGNQDIGYTINETVQVEKFNNGLKDKVAGSTFVLTFYETREANICIIPLN